MVCKNCSKAIEVKFKKLNDDTVLPTKAHPSDAGWDLYAAEDAKVLTESSCIISCGFAMALPIGYEAQIRPRSGLAAKHNITVLNTPGTIDCNYRGEVKVILFNHSIKGLPYYINKGDRIAQMVIQKLPEVVTFEVDRLNETDRGEDGFGSTG